MKMQLKNTFMLVAFALVFTIGYAQTPRELRGIDGMSYPDALRELRDEGYKLSNTSSMVIFIIRSGIVVEEFV